MAKKVFLILAVFVFLVFTEYRKVTSTPMQSWVDGSKGDCAVVLTGGSGRIQEGMALLNQNRVKKLIISGVNPSSLLSQIFPPIAFYGQVHVEDIILEKKSKTTYGNAQQSIAILGALKCQSVILITSRLHMHRAFRVFREHMPADIQLVARAIYSEKEEDSLMDLGTETLKSLFYNIWAY
tara:strand:+ start:935 stop:1477 length:543 start_codon:yes stop_codon:yes gene_type:complete